MNKVFKFVLKQFTISQVNTRLFCNSTIKQVQVKVEKYNTRSKGKRISPFGWSLLIVPVSTFCLGTWQVNRKKWKENLIRDLKERTGRDPVKLPASFQAIEELEYTPIHVRGHFLHNKEMYMGPRTLLAMGDSSTESSLMMKSSSTSQGYLVITPFKLADRKETILVNRGWVPTKLKNPDARKSGQIEGETDVIGVVRLQENRPNFMPANRAGTNNWFYRDVDEMAAVTGSDAIFLDATNDFDVKGGPIGGQTRITMRNEHLQYIFTWYSLSVLTSILWLKHFVKT